MITRERLAEEYYDHVNNYLTLEKFAEHRGLTVAEAEAESRARVYDSLANNPCMCDEVREVYRQRAFEVRVAAAKGGVA